MSKNPAGSVPSEADGFIPEEDYKKILDFVPVACVDIVVVLGDKFLMGKRINEPARGAWWIPGGRVFKGEILEETAVRKISEELGVVANTNDFTFLTGKETMFENSAVEGVSSHTINSVFVLKLNEEPEVNLNASDFSEVRWFGEIDENFHPYLKFVLGEAGFTLTPTG